MQQIHDVEDLLKFHEGYKLFPYKDTRGNLTWGIGHNLNASSPCLKALNLLQQAVEAQFQYDLLMVQQFLQKYPWFGALSEVRQAAVTDMAFNLGEKTFKEFTGFIAFLAAEKFADAADDLLKTAAAKELPERYKCLAGMLKDGVWPTI